MTRGREMAEGRWVNLYGKFRGKRGQRIRGHYYLLASDLNFVELDDLGANF